MPPFLLEFIDSDFMTGVFYFCCFLAGCAALAVMAVLWLLTRAGVRRWNSIRSSPQPVPLSRRLAAGLLVAPAVVAGITGIFGLCLGLWGEWYERWWYREHDALVRQHQAMTRTALTGHYFLADTMLLATGHDPFTNTARPAPVHAHLVLRPDSTYSYRSSIPNDVTLDTVGTRKLTGYAYDERFKYEQFAVVFASAVPRRCGLRISREGNGPTYFQGAYYHDNGFTSFGLVQARKPD